MPRDERSDERRLQGHPNPGLPLAARLYRLAERFLEAREVRYLGQVQSGTFRSRVSAFWT